MGLAITLRHLSRKAESDAHKIPRACPWAYNRGQNHGEGQMPRMARLSLVVVLSFVSACLAAADTGQEAVPGAIEGVVAEDLEDGRTAYECARETSAAEIVLTPMLVRAKSGAVLTYMTDGQPVDSDSTEVVEWSTSRSPGL
jgi:hypothetical protein